MIFKIMIEKWSLLKVILPIIPFSRINDLCTDPTKFIVTEEVYNNPVLIWLGIPLEVSSTELIIGAEENPLNGWHGYVHKDGWVGTGKNSILHKKLAKAVS